jgi:hypothetical protein
MLSVADATVADATVADVAVADAAMQSETDSPTVAGVLEAPPANCRVRAIPRQAEIAPSEISELASILHCTNCLPLRLCPLIDRLSPWRRCSHVQPRRSTTWLA